ncbi:MAG: alpha-ketoacid dehydrogenase subunit beta [Terracidiphilus sp.]
MSTVLQALNEAMLEAMTRDERVLIMGEDILDPYGGAFKLTKGLSTSFPDRVLTTPISEAAIVGIAAGLALRGMRPVVEIMFGDFLTLTFDQLLNHACKYRWMYNDQVRVPMVVRTPMGGRRGYGPTHSQCIEKHFLGIPGLRVVAPNALCDPKELLLHVILSDDDPTLFIEHKLLYLSRVGQVQQAGKLEVVQYNSACPYPVVLARVAGVPKYDVTIATYGYMADLVLDAVWRLAMEQEVFAEVIIPTCLSPFDASPILNSIENTGHLLTVEEGTVTLGWGSEVLSLVEEGNQKKACFVFRRIAARDLPIPSSRPLENAVLPSVQNIIDATMQLVAQ